MPSGISYSSNNYSTLNNNNNQNNVIITNTGPKYVNVKHRDVFLVTFLYSKMSLLFLCLIGLAAAINTYIFLYQLKKSEPLCLFNNYLPYGDEEVREMSMPIVYYCRFIEFSVPITFLQLILCIFALFFGLNRRSMLFFAAYCFLWMLLFHGSIFFIFLFVLNYERVLRTVFDTLLNYVINNDRLFCVAMEPFLHCKYPSDNSTDIIADKCQTNRKHHEFLHENCHDYMTEYLISRKWLLAIGVEYSFVILIGIYATIYAIIRFKTGKHQNHVTIREPYQRPHSASAVVNTCLLRNSITEDNDSAATL